MKKLLWTLLMVGMILPVTFPASAAKPEPIGDRINIFESGNQSFTPETPFHIAHGWSIDPRMGYPIARFSFELEIDGVSVEADFVETEFFHGADDPLRRLWVHNFPGGMTGEVEFTGRWFAPCQYAVDYGGYPGPCPDPIEVVEAKTTVVQVTFTP